MEPATRQPRTLFAFAGIWKRHVGPTKKDGHACSFMTTTPNELVATINHERMPVLLATPEAQDRWMEGTDAEAFELCRPYPPERMELVQTSLEKRDLMAG